MSWLKRFKSLASLKLVIFMIFEYLFLFVRVDRSSEFNALNCSDLDIYILIPKDLGLGDQVMLSPLVYEIEKKYPNSRIYILTEQPEFIDYDRAIKVVNIDYGSSSRRLLVAPTLSILNIKYILSAHYYLGYFSTRKLVSNISDIHYKSDLKYGHYFDKVFPIINVLVKEFDTYQDLIYPPLKSDKIQSNVSDPYICISPYVNWQARQYPYKYYYDCILNILSLTQFNIFIIGGSRQEEVIYNTNLYLDLNKEYPNRVVDFTGRISIKNSIYLINKSIAFIGNDSGPAHLAYSSKVRSFVIFGSVLPEARIPLNEDISSNIFTFDARSKCQYFPCYSGLSEPTCINDFKCLSSIDPLTLSTFILEKTSIIGS